MYYPVGTSKWMLEIFRRKYRGNSSLTKARHLAMSCMIHLLWQVRNQCQYEGESPNIERLFVKIQMPVFHFVSVWHVYPLLFYNAFTFSKKCTTPFLYFAKLRMIQKLDLWCKAKSHEWVNHTFILPFSLRRQMFSVHTGLLILPKFLTGFSTSHLSLQKQITELHRH